MAATTLTDVRLLSGGYEVTSDHNTIALDRTKETPESTVFGLKSRRYNADGLKTAAYTFDGFFDSDGTSAINDLQDAEWVGDVSQVLTVVAPDGAVGASAYSFDSVVSTLTDFGGTVGDMAAFSLAGNGTGDSFRGIVMEPGTTARSTSSNSSEYLVGDVVAGETARAALHVIATTGSPTLDVTLESDTTGFPSATTHITFVQATAVGAQYLTSTTTTTDTFWRAEWTFGGTGSITFLVTFGIN